MRPEFLLRIKGLLIGQLQGHWSPDVFVIYTYASFWETIKRVGEKWSFFVRSKPPFVVAHWLFTAGWQFSFLEKCARAFYGQQEATHCQIATGWILPFFKKTLQWLISLPLSASELRKTFSPGTTAVAQPVAGKHRGEGRHWPETELFSKLWWLTSCFCSAAL